MVWRDLWLNPGLLVFFKHIKPCSIIVVVKLREQAPSTNAGDASSNNTSNEDQVTILPRRSMRRKRPPPECFMCDHRIRGECSSNATNNLTLKKTEGVLSLLPARGNQKKERMQEGKDAMCYLICLWCDLFFGGEQDKPPRSGEIWWI